MGRLRQYKLGQTVSEYLQQVGLDLSTFVQLVDTSLRLTTRLQLTGNQQRLQRQIDHTYHHHHCVCICCVLTW